MKTKAKKKRVVKPFHVEVFESERGWGQSVLRTEKFTAPEKADEFVKEYNKRNTAPTAPDYYIAARRIN